MNESKPIANATDRAEPQYGVTEWTHFVGVDGMQAAAEADGWSIEYRQIGAGRLTASAATVDCADVALLDERVSSSVEVVGETPEEHLTVTIPWGVGKLWINGKWSTRHAFYVSEPRASMHFFSEQGIRALTMHVPTSLLPNSAYPDLGYQYGRSRIRTGWLESSAASAKRLKRLVHETTHRLLSGRWQVEQSSAVIGALLVSMNESVGAPRDHDHASRAERLRVIRHVREFIDAHLTEPIRIGQLSDHCAASLSKIERTFRRELQMSPREYIHARRLAAAQRELKRAEPGSTTVARVATDHGFSHLGRFAGAYSAQFGELPSETLGSN